MNIPSSTPRQYDLEDRSLKFAKAVSDLLDRLPKTEANKVYSEQLLRSSSSVGANYIEATDALGKKDFYMKIKTSRREARESSFWLRLLQVGDNASLQILQKSLTDEAFQLVRIFSAIAKTNQDKVKAI